jgi:hypothetical protein
MRSEHGGFEVEGELDLPQLTRINDEPERYVGEIRNHNLAGHGATILNSTIGIIPAR